MGLAIDGGVPVRSTMLPYGRQQVDEDDIAVVIEVLRSDWLTTGPKVAEFEQAFADLVGAQEAVAVSNGTAALHAAMHAVSIGPGDEVIVPAITFAATLIGIGLIMYIVYILFDVKLDRQLKDKAEGAEAEEDKFRV